MKRLQSFHATTTFARKSASEMRQGNSSNARTTTTNSMVMCNNGEKGFCPKCEKTDVNLTKHHILPQCFFGKEGDLIRLCRKCHDDLEIIIQQAEGKTSKKRRRQMPENRYYTILYEFLDLDIHDSTILHRA